MKSLDHYTNGHDGCDSEGSEGEADGETEDLSLVDAGAPARALGALNALRKSRQHYDVVLVAGGTEVPAHRAVLAAASPYLLEALAPASPPGAPYRVQDVEGEAVRALVEYAYTGRLVVRGAQDARRLYRAAWRLRLEAARAHLAEGLLRRLHPQDCLAVRALPGLTTEQLQVLDKYIADNFDELCSCGALATLPQIRIEVMRESAGAGSAADEAPLTVADAALAWLREQPATDRDFTELCSRPHLVFVDGRGLLRDCGELPAAAGDAPELQQYRRESAARKRAPAPAAAPLPAPRPLPALQLGARTDGTACAVLGARGCLGGGCRALLSVNGRLAGALAVWSGVARGAAAGPGAALQGGARLASLNGGRCALGAVSLGEGGALLACGGYDRARVLRAAELYDPRSNTWRAAPCMRRERARFIAATLGDTVYVIGGSDGHAELDSVDAYSEGRWRGVARLPLALSHAAGAADPSAGVLYVAGGWAQGTYLRRAFKYSPGEDVWSEAPPLATGRAQCAGVLWEGCMWVLGGCDAWHCLASTERLLLSDTERGWAAGPPLPTARRSVGGTVWRGRLVSVGGSDGAASLRRTDWLEAAWATHSPQPEVQQEGASLWQAGPLLRKARAGPGVAVLGEALYAVGGFDGKDFLACAECLLHPDGEWTAFAMHAAPQRGVGTKEGSDEKGGLNDIAEEEIVKRDGDIVKDLKKKLSVDEAIGHSEDASEKRTDKQAPATAAH